MLLALLSALSPQDATVPLERVAAAKVNAVASAQVRLAGFAATPDGLATALPGQRPLRLVLGGAKDGPAESLWIDANADGKRSDDEVVSLKWEDERFAEVDLARFGVDGELALFRNRAATIATLRTRYHFQGTLREGDSEITVRCIDMDGDGQPSRGDRWLALPSEQMRQLVTPNNMFVARETDEPWHHGTRELRIVEFRDGGVKLHWQPFSQPRDEFLAQRKARVDAWFAKSFDDSRDELFAQYHIAADRPRAEPVRWYSTLEFADARAFAKKVGRPLLVEFSRDGCSFCKMLPWVTYKDAAVVARLQRFACVQIDSELDRERTAEAHGERGVPVLMLFDADGKLLHKIGGFQPPQEFAASLDAAIAKAGLPAVRD